MRNHSWVVLLALAACGDDGDAPAPPPRAAGAAPARAAVAKPPGNQKQLASRMKAEDRVACPLPERIEQGVAPCDANVQLCAPVPAGEPKNYCLPFTDGKYYCLPCAERDAIRHMFSERDFAVEQSNRDPFQSFVLAQPGLGSTGDGALPREITKDCTEKNMVATNYSYTDLRLVGIVAERAQRRVLMMDGGNLGHIIKKNDCVGREKAIVKDIGAGYITFQVTPDELPGGQTRAVEEHSVQLYPNQMPLTSQPRLDLDPPRASAPVIAPPTITPGPSGPAERGRRSN